MVAVLDIPSLPTPARPDARGRDGIVIRVPTIIVWTRRRLGA